MKKLLILFVCLLTITGCTNKNQIKTFMMKNNEDKYLLYDNKGDLKSKLEFTHYLENNERGYVVYNEEEQCAYIDYYGDIVVDFGIYDKLSFADDMIIGTTLATNETEEIYTIMNNEGKKIYRSDEIQMQLSSLPIIIKDENNKEVLYKNGESLITTSSPIEKAVYDKQHRYYVLSGKEANTSFYYNKNDEMNCMTIEITGLFEISDALDNEILLYDKDLNNLIYINLEEEMNYIYNNMKAENISFDDNRNIIIENNGTISLIRKELNTPITMNSYYQNAYTYVYRSKEVYGPHGIYNNGEIKGNITNCQIYPAPIKIEGNYYPVYVKDQGYQYYDFEGKQPFTTSYYDASPFDKNNRAIVKIDAEKTYLINETGTTITNDYFQIKYINSSYYAVYNKDGLFGIIDKDGKEILGMQYTSLTETSVFYYNGTEYLMLEKYGRTYVYNTAKDFEEVFSIEGNVIFNEKGIYEVNNESYYTFDGELIS